MLCLITFSSILFKVCPSALPRTAVSISALSNDWNANLHHAGLVDLAQPMPAFPAAFAETDLQLLGLQCDAVRATPGVGAYLGTSQGRIYSCEPTRAGAAMNVNVEYTDAAGRRVTGRTFVSWPAYGPDVPAHARRPWRVRFATEAPSYDPAPPQRACDAPDPCAPGCGLDMRCGGWYAARGRGEAAAGAAGPADPRLRSEIYIEPFSRRAAVAVQRLIFAPDGGGGAGDGPPMAVAGSNVFLDGLQSLIDDLPCGNATHMALVVNDEQLSLLAARGCDSAQTREKLDGSVAVELRPLARAASPHCRALRSEGRQQAQCIGPRCEPRRLPFAEQRRAPRAASFPFLKK